VVNAANLLKCRNWSKSNKQNGFKCCIRLTISFTQKQVHVGSENESAHPMWHHGIPSPYHGIPRGLSWIYWFWQPIRGMLFPWSGDGMDICIWAACWQYFQSSSSSSSSACQVSTWWHSLQHKGPGKQLIVLTVLYKAVKPVVFFSLQIPIDL